MSDEAQRAHELATLCRSCGLCCDGSLFQRVPLDADEVEGARKIRLAVVSSASGGAWFEQPCAALVPCGTTPSSFGCSVYDERPAACRRFVCRLHEHHRAHGGPLERRLERVRRVRELVARLDASGFDPFELADDGGEDQADSHRGEAKGFYRELVRHLETDFARAL